MLCTEINNLTTPSLPPSPSVCLCFSLSVCLSVCLCLSLSLSLSHPPSRKKCLRVKVLSPLCSVSLSKFVVPLSKKNKLLLPCFTNILLCLPFKCLWVNTTCCLDVNQLTNNKSILSKCRLEVIMGVDTVIKYQLVLKSGCVYIALGILGDVWCTLYLHMGSQGLQFLNYWGACVCI